MFTHSGCFGFLSQSSDMHDGLNGNSKLIISEHAWLFDPVLETTCYSLQCSFSACYEQGIGYGLQVIRYLVTFLNALPITVRIFMDFYVTIVAIKSALLFFFQTDGNSGLY